MTRAEKRRLAETLSVEHAYVGHGLVQYTAFLRDDPTPAGVVWSIELRDTKTNKTRADILWTYVHADYRRCGVATRMFCYMLSAAGGVDVLSTWAGSRLGTRFMRSFGFRHWPRQCLWVCTKRDRARRLRKQ